MAITVNSPGWSVRRAGTARGAAGDGAAIPREFLTEARTTEEFAAEPLPPARGGAAAPGALDVTCDLAPGEAAVLLVRHPSGALTIHAPRETVSRTRGGPGEVRFVAPVRTPTEGDLTASRGVV